VARFQLLQLWWFPCGEDDSRWWLQGVWIQIRLAGAVVLQWPTIDEQVR